MNRLGRLVCAVLLLTVSITSEAAVTNSSPVSLGVSYGNLLDYYQEYELVSLLPWGAVSSAGKVYLYKQQIDEGQFIYETKNKQIKQLLDIAALRANEEGGLFYGISNIRATTVYTDKRIFVETWADIVVCKLKKKK